MYRLMISPTDSGKFGLARSKDFYLSSASEVCDVLTALAGKDILFTLTEIHLSCVHSVVASIEDL